MRKAKAHSGVGLCLTEIADFDGAIRNFELGLALIEDSQDDQAIGLRPRLMLNMGVCELYRGRANDALVTLRSAQSIAQGLQDRVLAAKCVDAQALATIDTDDCRALALATEAATVGTQTGSPELARETNNTLALIHLRLRQIPEARAAANVAVEFGRTRRGLGGFAMLGIALLRDREPELAEGAFLKAHVRASELLLKEKNAYQLHEFDGLALTGLALSAGSDECLQLAQAAYCRARRRTRASGVVQLCLQKLNALLDGNSDPEFDRIRAAARTGKTQA
jgi:tetratricopeptide (TPR) repeat protein